MDNFDVVGTVIENKSARWTILETPKFSHSAPGTGEPIYRALAFYEPKRAGLYDVAKSVVVNLSESDLIATVRKV